MCNMIRYRVFLLFLLPTLITASDSQDIAEPQPTPDKQVLTKSTPYSKEDTITSWIQEPKKVSNEEDLSASASEYRAPKYLPPANNKFSRGRNCFDCNNEPWIPIVGRSLPFPTHPSSHSSSAEQGINKKFQIFHPQIDQYGAPQGSFELPPIGEVVDFMLPPPYKSGSIISGLGDVYNFNFGPQRPNYGAPKQNFGPVPSFKPIHQFRPPPSNNYGAPRQPQKTYLPQINHPIPTTYLRPVTQDFQPPLPQPGINHLPLENNLPPPIPSDSYGRPVSNNYGAPPSNNFQTNELRPPPSNNYGAPVQNHLSRPSPGYNTLNSIIPPPPPPSDSYGAPLQDAITLGSGDSEESGYRVPYKQLPQGNFLHNGLTDVQVVPSIQIADYTASIEHPINLIQSPILDINIKDQKFINEQIEHNVKADLSSYGDDGSNKIESRNRLSENPIFVDDTYTSASDINSTYSSEENSTTIKRHNDRFIGSGSFENQVKDIDLTDNLIQKLLLEHNIIEDPKTQIVGIKKTIIDPQKVSTNFNLVTPSMDYSGWGSSQYSTLPTVMVPPKPVSTTWMAPVNESFAKFKHSKKLQIIVPYLRNPDNHLQHSTGMYNKEYTTLTPVFVPPPVTSEATNLWTQLVDDMRTVESNKDAAQSFQTPSSTEVYNINDFLAKQTYDIQSLQKNIDDWTHQSYSNRYNFGDKISTKLSYVKKIPGEYLTTSTPSYGKNTVASNLRAAFRALDHETSSSDKKEFISNEIDDVATSTAAPSTEPPKVRFIVKKPTLEKNKVTLSNSTHEKIYVVTPQSYAQLQTSTPPTAYSMSPRIQNGRVNNVASMTRISVRVEAPKENEVKEKKPVTVIYSEWPHLINDLETTTTPRPTSRHPLFGLVDLAPFTLPPNSSVQTISGHSKVFTMVTSPITRPSSTTPMPNQRRSETVKVLPEA